MALITYLTKNQFDFGALALVPEELAALGIARPRQVMNLSEGADLAGAVADLNARPGLPAGLAEMGLPADLIPDLAVAATRGHRAETNPRAAGAADYEALSARRWGDETRLDSRAAPR